MSLPFTFPHTGPGAEADAEFHAAHAFQIQCAQGFHSIIETFVVRVCERQNRGQQRLEAHVQAAVFQQEGHAVRQTLVPSRQNAEKVLEGFGRLRHERHNQRPIDALAYSDCAPRHHVPLARPELRSEVRVQDVMQFLSFARIGVRQTERQRIAGHKRLPCPVGELRRDAQADVPQGLMRRERPGQQIRLPEGVQHTCQKTVMRVMQGGDGTGNLLTTRKCGHFGYGRVAFLQRRLPQGVGQHGGLRPQHNPACFQSTVALQGMAPILQQRADMQAEVVCRQARRLKKLGNSFSAAFRVIFKDHLKGVPRFGKRGLELFRQAGDDGRVFFHPHMLQRAFQMKKADEASVIGHEYAVIHGFKTTVTVNRPGERFRESADAAIHAVDKYIKHYASLLSTTC